MLALAEATRSWLHRPSRSPSRRRLGLTRHVPPTDHMKTRRILQSGISRIPCIGPQKQNAGSLCPSGLLGPRVRDGDALKRSRGEPWHELHVTGADKGPSFCSQKQGCPSKGSYKKNAQIGLGPVLGICLFFLEGAENKGRQKSVWGLSLNGVIRAPILGSGL